MSRSVSRAPKPDVMRAILINARSKEPTWHKFVGAFECILADHTYVDPETGKEKTLKGGPAWEFVYVSEESPKVQRTWGVADSKSPRTE